MQLGARPRLRPHLLNSLPQPLCPLPVARCCHIPQAIGAVSGLQHAKKCADETGAYQVQYKLAEVVRSVSAPARGPQAPGGTALQLLLPLLMLLAHCSIGASPPSPPPPPCCSCCCSPSPASPASPAAAPPSAPAPSASIPASAAGSSSLMAAAGMSGIRSTEQVQ